MKIRSGFVSNSSSSSFVIDKDKLLKEILQKFRELMNDYNREQPGGEGYIYESPKHFFGEISYHATEIREFIKQNKIEIDEDA